MKALTEPRHHRRSWADFTSSTTEHEMYVLRDDGLYRHLRFMAPGTYMWGFDLVTWPGYLTICGDIGSYTFARTRNMFAFFADEAGGINPDYWAQKLQGPHRGRDLARTYSAEVLRQRLDEWAHQEVQPDYCFDASADECWFYERDLVAALDRELQLHDLWSEEAARAALDDIQRWEEVDFGETWEWDLRDWDNQFLNCCWAIAHGVATYREAQPAAEAVAA